MTERYQSDKTLLGFNRTFMELKFAKIKEYAIKDNGFNRTFMELKWHKCKRTTIQQKF